MPLAPFERIPLHDHVDRNSGGPLAPSEIHRVVGTTLTPNDPTSHNTLHDVTSDQHHAQLHAATHQPSGSDAVSTAAPSGGYGSPATGSGTDLMRASAVLPKPTEADLSLSDVTTNDASSGQHGFLPKLPGSSSQVLRGDGTYGTVPSGTGIAFHGFRLVNSVLQAIANSSLTALLFDTETFDTDNYHFQSAAALTGTVAKTATSAAIVGTGTLFTTELSVNQVISIPGTATEIGVVKTITDNTHLTLWQTMANSASGQTATRRNEYVGIPAGSGGYYVLEAAVSFVGHADSNRRSVDIQVSGSTIVDNIVPALNSGSVPTRLIASTTFHLSDGDYVAALVLQLSTVSLNTDPGYPTHFTGTFVGV